ncbi:hypothetical protein ANN_23010 [Periplaneta americana]|uniref:Uncharacterized protein n=1 Tax=Periplaneta americana TaxID=6978 RepID=A0ABQ8SKA5_PERAM|nr:hypothetical protein ANN_23010 [Periplaneta americana]
MDGNGRFHHWKNIFNSKTRVLLKSQLECLTYPIWFNIKEEITWTNTERVWRQTLGCPATSTISRKHAIALDCPRLRHNRVFRICAYTTQISNFEKNTTYKALVDKSTYMDNFTTSVANESEFSTICTDNE